MKRTRHSPHDRLQFFSHDVFLSLQSLVLPSMTYKSFRANSLSTSTDCAVFGKTLRSTSSLIQKCRGTNSFFVFSYIPLTEEKLRLKGCSPLFSSQNKEELCIDRSQEACDSRRSRVCLPRFLGTFRFGCLSLTCNVTPRSSEEEGESLQGHLFYTLALLSPF